MGILNLSYFTGNSDSLTIKQGDIPLENDEKKRRSRKATDIINTDGVEIMKPLPMYQSNQPYIDTFQETNNLLKSSINQIDDINNDVIGEIKTIKDSKTMKNKYNVLSDLTATSASLISTKINAIREINKSINDSHNLDMKRAKEIMKVDSANDVDDDKKILDMYNAFISAPIGMDTRQYAPQIQSMGNLPTSVIGSQEVAYNNFLNNLTPSQTMMLHEDNPNVRTVIRYDPNTGSRKFDVVDLCTGQSIPNASIPADMFLEDTVIDLKNNLAKNTNLNTTYPLIVESFNKTVY